MMTKVVVHRATDWAIDTTHWAWAILAAMIFWVGVSALDREPPFEILPHDPVTVRAGSWAVINLPVHRDLTRECDAKYSRYLIDASGARADINGESYAPDAFIRAFEDATPGRMIVKLPIPPIESAANRGGVVPGPARIKTPIRYYCAKGHLFWPILVQTEISINIVP